MALQVLIHVLNDEAILAEIERMPNPQDTCLIVVNPRKRDGKSIPTLADGVKTVVYPWTRITYLEILDGEDDEEGGDGIVGFFREDRRAVTGD